jgi:hypothetical protein
MGSWVGFVYTKRTGKCVHRIGNRNKNAREEIRKQSTAPFFPKAKSEGWATRKIRGEIEWLRVGHPPIIFNGGSGQYSPPEQALAQPRTLSRTRVRHWKQIIKLGMFL